MKKLITLASTLIGFGFAIALATAEDTTSDTTGAADARSAKMMSTCTDAKGVTHRPGEKGYKACMKASKEQHKSGMEGEAGVAASPTMAPSPR